MYSRPTIIVLFKKNQPLEEWWYLFQLLIECLVPRKRLKTNILYTARGRDHQLPRLKLLGRAGLDPSHAQPDGDRLRTQRQTDRHTYEMSVLHQYYNWWTNTSTIYCQRAGSTNCPVWNCSAFGLDPVTSLVYALTETAWPCRPRSKPRPTERRQTSYKETERQTYEMSVLHQ